jgi:hypothetical protein
MKFSKGISIDLVVFCTQCEQVLRRVEADDMNGDLNWCETCKENTITAISLSVETDTPQQLEYVLEKIQENLPAVADLLLQRNPIGNEYLDPFEEKEIVFEGENDSGSLEELFKFDWTEEDDDDPA